MPNNKVAPRFPWLSLVRLPLISLVFGNLLLVISSIVHGPSLDTYLVWAAIVGIAVAHLLCLLQLYAVPKAILLIVRLSEFRRPVFFAAVVSGVLFVVTMQWVLHTIFMGRD